MSEIKPGQIWRHKRNGRRVTVLSKPVIDTAGNRVLVKGQRTSAILVRAFLTDYEQVDERVEGDG